MDANKIIDDLGGTNEVARLCDIKPASVSEWRTNGIPKARLMYLRLLRPDVFGEKRGKSTPGRRHPACGGRRAADKKAA
jgi:hypothetical protein